MNEINELKVNIFVIFVNPRLLLRLIGNVKLPIAVWNTLILKIMIQAIQVNTSTGHSLFDTVTRINWQTH